MKQLQSLPWVVLLIVKLALEDKSLPMLSGDVCSVEEFEKQVNFLWNVPFIEEGVPLSTTYLALKSMIYTQLLFQRRENWSFIRWPAIIAALPADHISRRQFLNEFQMEPDTFIGMGFATLGVVADGKDFIGAGVFEPLRPLYGKAIDSFRDRFTSDVLSIRAQLQSELKGRLEANARRKVPLPIDAAARPNIELCEFPWLSRCPLLRYDANRLISWHKAVSAQALERAAHAGLTPLGQEYTDAFSKVFENYVIELARSWRRDLTDDKTFKGSKRGLNAVDALVPMDGANVFIESKMSLFPDDLVWNDDVDHVFIKLKHVRKAIAQAWKVGALLRDGTRPVAKCADAREDFLLVVTSRELSFGFGYMLHEVFGDRLLAQSKYGRPTDAQLKRLPMKNVFILSIEEFENLIGYLKEGGRLVPILRKAAAESENPVTRKLAFDQVLRDYSKKSYLSDLMQTARDRVYRIIVGGF